MALDTIVIVGASHAGFQAAASLRQLKFPSRVVLIGDEPGLPYHRPPLSKDFLTGVVQEDGLRLRPAAFFEKANIELRDRTRVVAIRRDSRTVETDTSETMSYDHLILATGARHRTLRLPGADLAGVIALRNRQEAARLKTMLSEARDIVVIGAGFIGLEFAATAIKAGGKVTVLEMAPRPLARAVSAPVSHALLAAHRSWGTTIRTGVTIRALHGEAGHVRSLELLDGETIQADLVLVGIGVEPNVDLAANAGLAVENGILVNELLLTADPAISAIGDCAAYPSPFSGGIARLESVQNATDHARAVAERLVGKPVAYAKVPWFWSDQGTMKLQIVGLTADHDHAVCRGDPSNGSFSVFCFREGRFLGIESINQPSDHMAGRKLLSAPCSLTPEQAGDLGYDLMKAGQQQPS